MRKINILIVDKDVLVRQAIARVLNRESSFKIVGVRGDAEDPDKHIANKNPDVILLNVDSMDSDGLAALQSIRNRFPGLPVVVLSPRTREGARAAIAALQIGAVDFVTKPEYSNSVLFANRHFRKRLIPIVRVAADLKDTEKQTALTSESASGLPKASVKHTPEKGKSRSRPANMVVIGGCTGGPKALFSIIPGLSAGLPVPVVVVQHLPKIYTSVLAEKLDEQSDITVREAYDGAELKPGTVWIASGGHHCELHREGNRNAVKSHRGQRENNNRPSIDTLFRSARHMHGSGILGVILSGCGRDGVNGSEIIRDAGGKIIAQDPQTALAPEMPTAVIRAGLIEGYYSDTELAERIVKQVSRGREAVSGRVSRQFAGRNFISESSRIQKDLF